MIPIGNTFVAGYYLISTTGDVYCFGDIPFYGTLQERFKENVSIVACVESSGYLEIISDMGEIYTLSDSPSKRTIDNVSNVIDACRRDDAVVVLTREGLVVGEDSTRFTFQSKAPFIACSLSSNGRDIYALDGDGRVHCSQGEHYGDLTTIDVKDVLPAGICCSPWGQGYWIIDSIGGVFCFGDVDYFGSVPGDSHRSDAKQIVSSPSGHGYWIVDRRGMSLPFGDAAYLGHLTPGETPNPIACMIVVTRPDRNDKEWLFTQLVNRDMAQLKGEAVEAIPEPVAP